MDAAPVCVPTYKSFPTSTSEPGSPATSWTWDVTSLRPGDRGLFLALVAYDLGRCYLFCEEYTKAKLCFAKYFEHTGDQMRRESRQILNNEIDASSLAGYLMVLDMPPPGGCEYKVREATFIREKLLENENNPEEQVTVLEHDDMTGNFALSARETFEEELVMNASDEKSSGKTIVSRVQIHNIVKRTMLGLPLSIKHRNVLSHIRDTNFLEAILTRHLGSANKTQKALLRMLAIELIIAGVISGKSQLIQTLGVGQVGILRGAKENRKSRNTAIQTLKIETFGSYWFGSEKIELLNKSLQFLSSFNPEQIRQLVNSISDKTVRRITSKWSLEYEQLSRQKNVSDKTHMLPFILLAKVNQLKNMKRFTEAGLMLDFVKPICKAGVNISKNLLYEQKLFELKKSFLYSKCLFLNALRQNIHLCGKSDAEQLLLKLEDPESSASPVTLASVRETDCLARLGHAPTTLVAALTSLCNSGDWEAVTRLSQPSLPHVASLGPVGQNPHVRWSNLLKPMCHGFGLVWCDLV